MTEGIFHINGIAPDPWGYSAMNEQQLLAAAKELAHKINNETV